MARHVWLPVDTEAIARTCVPGEAPSVAMPEPFIPAQMEAVQPARREAVPQPGEEAAGINEVRPKVTTAPTPRSANLSSVLTTPVVGEGSGGAAAPARKTVVAPPKDRRELTNEAQLLFRLTGESQAVFEGPSAVPKAKQLPLRKFRS